MRSIEAKQTEFDQSIGLVPPASSRACPYCRSTGSSTAPTDLDPLPRLRAAALVSTPLLDLGRQDQREHEAFNAKVLAAQPRRGRGPTAARSVSLSARCMLASCGPTSHRRREPRRTRPAPPPRRARDGPQGVQHLQGHARSRGGRDPLRISPGAPHRPSLERRHRSCSQRDLLVGHPGRRRAAQAAEIARTAASASCCTATSSTSARATPGSPTTRTPRRSWRAASGSETGASSTPSSSC